MSTRPPPPHESQHPMPTPRREPTPDDVIAATRALHNAITVTHGYEQLLRRWEAQSTRPPDLRITRALAAIAQAMAEAERALDVLAASALATVQVIDTTP